MDHARCAGELTLPARLRASVGHQRDSPVAASGAPGLPAAVEELLVEVVTEGFTLHCCGPRTAPNALVAAYEWNQYVDLITIRDFERIVTARVPKRDAIDVFAPQAVVWAYEGPPQPALRALLCLVHPAHPDAPTCSYPAPARLHVPRAQQRPMTIQLPAPGRAQSRAARLVAVMAASGGDRAGGTVSETGPQDRRLAVG